VFSTEIVNHGGRCGDAMQELARWRHPLASSEALDVLHRVMRPAWHRHIRIRMVIEIIVNLPAFFVALISLFATTISKDHVMINIK
jgi:hypothetical protein